MKSKPLQGLTSKGVRRRTGAICPPQSLHLSRLLSSTADICQKLDPF